MAVANRVVNRNEWTNLLRLAAVLFVCFDFLGLFFARYLTVGHWSQKNKRNYAPLVPPPSVSSCWRGLSSFPFSFFLLFRFFFLLSSFSYLLWFCRNSTSITSIRFRFWFFFFNFSIFCSYLPMKRLNCFFDSTLPSFTEFYRVLSSFIEFYRVLSSFTEFLFSWRKTGITGKYRGFSDFSRFPLRK